MAARSGDHDHPPPTHLLLHLGGLTNNEITAHLDLTHTNINRHVTRSRRHLRPVRDDH
ncbi:MAG TPA: hypothetical protein VK501_10480 [Baekduia sp.]|uniref:hypothetical protein n=1 Tax=Baekduia sp. TaxID=2600305 RepID=UPI002BD3F96F|nr:hypothetical protein [Baekduia sp.]HMJ34335.1 hypothetical protein [Baekduia sp.]